MSDDRRAKEERRKKIRQLEASLFGATSTTPDDAFKVDVPGTEIAAKLFAATTDKNCDLI